MKLNVEKLQKIREEKVKIHCEIEIEEEPNGEITIDITGASTDKLNIEVAKIFIEEILKTGLQAGDFGIDEIPGDYEGDLSILITLP